MFKIFYLIPSDWEVLGLQICICVHHNSIQSLKGWELMIKHECAQTKETTGPKVLDLCNFSWNALLMSNRSHHNNNLWSFPWEKWQFVSPHMYVTVNQFSEISFFSCYLNVAIVCVSVCVAAFVVVETSGTRANTASYGMVKCCAACYICIWFKQRRLLVP